MLELMTLDDPDDEERICTVEDVSNDTVVFVRDGEVVDCCEVVA